MTKQRKIKIGQLKNKETYLQGYITNEVVDRAILLEPNKNKQTTNSPDYHIFMKGDSGNRFLAGAGWEKIAKAKDHAGEKFISMTIELATLKQKFNVVAYEDKEQAGVYDLLSC